MESDLPLLLRDVAVKGLRLLLDVGLQHDLVDFPLGLAEDDGAAVATSVKVDEVGDDCVAVVVGAVEGEVLDGLGGADIRVLDKINKFTIRRQILPGKVDDPRWDRG